MKLKAITLIFILLSIIYSPSIAEERDQSRINFKLGLLNYFIQAGYDYEFSYTGAYGSCFNLKDSVENNNALGFDLGFGFSVTKNIEITGSFNYFTKTLEGTYEVELDALSTLAYYDETGGSPDLKESIINFGVNLYPLGKRNISPYIGGGISRIQAKMDLLKGEKNNVLSFTVVSVRFKDTSINKFGFNVKAGLNYYIYDILAFFAEGRYILGAKSKVSHPFISRVFEEEELEIDLGGFSGTLGFKFFF